jgi:HAD superfamily hydrolase (TIGR01662 family)
MSVVDAVTRRPSAVLFDRDGTLVHDVPYNTDPRAVTPVPGAREAVGRLRAAGIAVGVVSNQSGIGRGLITPAQLGYVNARITELLGPFAVWRICPHAPDEGCPCRKPAPGLVLGAAAELGVPASDCVVIGDIGADMLAAQAAGAAAILVPTPVTLPAEIAAAPAVAATITAAVDAVLGTGSPVTGAADAVLGRRQ